MTELAGVVGWPIGHSLSPAIFRAAFAELGLDWDYQLLEADEAALPALMDAVRAKGYRGLSVTMPCKAAVIPLLDELSPESMALGAVNCVRRDGDHYSGHNTDGAGFVDSLRRDEGVDLAGARVVVLGAGGAGRSVIRAVAAAGAGAVVVVNRSPDRAHAGAVLGGSVGRVGTVDDVAGADVVVNATPAGMGEDRRMPLDPADLHEGQVVVDLVYHPARTPLLAAAEAAGARAVGGLGMLVHQAAHQLRLWTGDDPPVEVMRAGAERALAERALADGDSR